MSKGIAPPERPSERPTDPHGSTTHGAGDGAIAPVESSFQHSGDSIVSLVSGAGSGTIDASWDVTSLASHDLSNPALPTVAHHERLIAGRYLVEKQLPSGGMSILYLVHDIQDDRRVVIKHLNARFATKESYIEKELKALQKFSHPGVIKVWDIRRLRISGEESPLCLIMEYAEGPTLKDCLPHQQVHQTGSCEWMQAVMTHLLEAVAHIHLKGVIHRDLKPENMIVTAPDVIKLIDFGLAADVVEVRSRERGCGTYFYTAPEVLGGQESTPRSDVYSLGMILYELLTGIKTTGNLTRPSDWWKEEEKGPRPFPKALDDVVMCAMAAQPAKRYANAQIMADAFQQAFTQGPWETSQMPIPVLQDAIKSRSFRPSGGRPRSLTAWLGLFALLVVLGFLLQRQDTAQPPAPVRRVVLPVDRQEDAGSKHPALQPPGQRTSPTPDTLRQRLTPRSVVPQGRCASYWLLLGRFATSQAEQMLMTQSLLWDVGIETQRQTERAALEDGQDYTWLVAGHWPTRKAAHAQSLLLQAKLKAEKKKLGKLPSLQIIAQTRWKTPWPDCQMVTSPALTP